MIIVIIKNKGYKVLPLFELDVRKNFSLKSRHIDPEPSTLLWVSLKSL